ncbi:hypothetical protein IWQ60_001257 [Tieghemiomyces parasiticus]|uniref:Uncharacterized protein n=1 Tax=Tieghemiomyces parasiticus TaxID=78921 RepID=A0A9W8AK67_9FUNG|nr:hypothetical protein IWQ60_001257 [Tieghemiomyces parasiticus]
MSSSQPGDQRGDESSRGPSGRRADYATRSTRPVSPSGRRTGTGTRYRADHVSPLTHDRGAGTGPVEYGRKHRRDETSVHRELPSPRSTSGTRHDPHGSPLSPSATGGGRRAGEDSPSDRGAKRTRTDDSPRRDRESHAYDHRSPQRVYPTGTGAGGSSRRTSNVSTTRPPSTDTLSTAGQAEEGEVVEEGELTEDSEEEGQVPSHDRSVVPPRSTRSAPSTTIRLNLNPPETSRALPQPPPPPTTPPTAPSPSTSAPLSAALETRSTPPPSGTPVKVPSLTRDPSEEGEWEEGEEGEIVPVGSQSSLGPAATAAVQPSPPSTKPQTLPTIKIKLNLGNATASLSQSPPVSKAHEITPVPKEEPEELEPSKVPSIAQVDVQPDMAVDEPVPAVATPEPVEFPHTASELSRPSLRPTDEPSPAPAPSNSSSPAPGPAQLNDEASDVLSITTKQASPGVTATENLIKQEGEEKGVSEQGEPAPGPITDVQDPLPNILTQETPAQEEAKPELAVVASPAAPVVEATDMNVDQPASTPPAESTLPETEPVSKPLPKSPATIHARPPFMTKPAPRPPVPQIPMDLGAPCLGYFDYVPGRLLPCFTGREGGVFFIRIPSRHLSWTNPQLLQRSVWGTGIYTDDSDVVAMLVHDGAITLPRPVPSSDMAKGHTTGTSTPPARRPAEGGVLVGVEVGPKLVQYQGTERHEFRSRTWGDHDGVSWRIRCVIPAPDAALAVGGSRHRRKQRLRENTLVRCRTLGDKALSFPGYRYDWVQCTVGGGGPQNHACCRNSAQ